MPSLMALKLTAGGAVIALLVAGYWYAYNSGVHHNELQNAEDSVRAYRARDSVDNDVTNRGSAVERLREWDRE